MSDFEGAKIAILRGGDVLTLLRDDNLSISFPNQWDFPGGGRHHDETPLQTVARELLEELNVTLEAAKIIHHVEEDSASNPEASVHFFVARWDDLIDANIVLGDEGQRWQWMPIAEFLSRKDAVISLRGRLSRALRALDIRP
jgi:8-oxo-dGTP diphosphatase